MRDITLDDCIFYHTIDIPGLGLKNGPWDYRSTADIYLGRLDFRGKTVVEIGPANGFFTFTMEEQGATVTAVDLGEADAWDMVPGPLIDHQKVIATRLETVRKIGNAFWLAHQAKKSRARLVYSTVYKVKDAVPPHQISIIANVLQHLRDPFLALEQLARVTTETMVVTETLWTTDEHLINNTEMLLIPRADIPEVDHSWWQVSPALVREILKMLGFPNVRCEFHEHSLIDGANPSGRKVPHFTCVGSR